MPNKDIAKTGLARKVQLILFSLLAIVALGFGIFGVTRTTNHATYKDVKIGSETFKLEVADTEMARVRGLSDRNHIGKNEGMLFDFNTLGNWGIWMLNMRFSIDIVWLDEAGVIVHIQANAMPESYPGVFRTDMPNRYVIELPDKTLERLDIKTGDVLDVGQ